MFAASKSGGGAQSDPNLEYVTTLLNGSGTNGAQNNTFLDSSANAATITRVGNTTQGTTTPFGDYWSNYFPGTASDYLTAAGTALGYGTSDVTIECWIYRIQLNHVDSIYTGTRSPSAAGGFGIKISAANQIAWNTNTSFGSGASTVSVGVWHHIAVTRYSGALRFFLDGVLDYYNASFAQNCTNQFCVIGKTDDATPLYANMYITNFRMVVGSQVYPTASTTVGTTIFTPPITPLTAVTGTVLLTAQNNRFVDNSANGYAIVPSGLPSVQRFNNYGFSTTTVPYNPDTTGGALYFDGTGDYLSAASNTGYALGTGDYTLEFWIYATAAFSGTKTFYSNNSGGYFFQYVTGTGLQTGVGGGATTGTYAVTLYANTWYHIAISRATGSSKCFVNGVQVGTTVTDTNNYAQNGAYVGALYSATNLFTGYISNLRLLKGTALYTTTPFTPPTAPLTAITNTQLLLSGTNAAIYDSVLTTIWETSGTAQVSTAVQKFGTGSMAFDASANCWLTSPNSVATQLEANNFTIEGWVYLNTTGVLQSIVSKGAATSGWYVNVSAANKLQFSSGSSSNLVGATSLSASTWYYFTVVRSGTATTNLKIYLNGTLDATSGTALTDNFNQTNPMYVGVNRTAASPLNGYVDDLRITKGLARYTSNFAPPTQQLPGY